MENKVAETDRLKQEGITLTERIKALLTGQRIDRVPVWLWLMSSSFATRNVGDSIASSNNHPEKSFWAQLRTIQMYAVTM